MNEHISAQRDLGTVLRKHLVSYLIETADRNRLPKQGNCYILEEPHSGQAGKLSRKMYGHICAEPLEHFVTTYNKSIGMQTYIFDVR